MNDDLLDLDGDFFPWDENEYSAADYDRDREDDRLNSWDGDEESWKEDHKAA